MRRDGEARCTVGHVISQVDFQLVFTVRRSGRWYRIEYNIIGSFIESSLC